MHQPSTPAVEGPLQTSTEPFRILIVTDRTDLVESFRRGLKALGSRADSLVVESVSTGEAAGRRCERKTFGLLVMDAGVTDVSPLALLQGARAHHPATKAILFADGWDEMLARSMTESGLDVCVSLREAYKVDFSRRVVDLVSGNEAPHWSDGFRGALEMLNEAAALADESGVIVYANPAFCEATGSGRDDPVGRRLDDFFPELDDADSGVSLLDLRRASGNTQAVEARFFRTREKGAARIGVIVRRQASLI